MQANQEKSRLLAQASHDLRQPIHSIGLFTACLRDARLGDEERRLVDNIDRSLLNVSQLFRSILDLYTLDNGRLQPKQENVHLGELLRDLVRRNAEAARWAGVELRLRPCRLWTRTDPGLLSTMLQNLLSNSLKYAAERPLLIGVRRRAMAVAIYDQGRGSRRNTCRGCSRSSTGYARRATATSRESAWGCPSSAAWGGLTGIEVTLRSRVGRGTAVTLHGLPAVAAQALPAATIPCRPACSPACGCAWWKMIATSCAPPRRCSNAGAARSRRKPRRTAGEPIATSSSSTTTSAPTPPASSASSGYGGNAERRYRRW